MFSNYGAGVKTLKRSAVLSKVKNSNVLTDFFNLQFEFADSYATNFVKYLVRNYDYDVVGIEDAVLLNLDSSGAFYLELGVPITFRMSEVEQRLFLSDVNIREPNCEFQEIYDIVQEDFRPNDSAFFRKYKDRLPMDYVTTVELASIRPDPLRVNGDLITVILLLNNFFTDFADELQLQFERVKGFNSFP